MTISDAGPPERQIRGTSEKMRLDAIVEGGVKVRHSKPPPGISEIDIEPGKRLSAQSIAREKPSRMGRWYTALIELPVITDHLKNSVMAGGLIEVIFLSSVSRLSKNLFPQT